MLYCVLRFKRGGEKNQKASVQCAAGCRPNHLQAAATAHLLYTLFYYKTLETEVCGILSYRRSQYENEKATSFPLLSVWTGHSWPGWHHHGSGGWSHHWGPWHHWHVSTHWWPHPWSYKGKENTSENSSWE